LKTSRILAEMHETARGLHRAGAIDKRTMCEFDALCLPPVILNPVSCSTASEIQTSGVKAPKP
jgi:DNA-binding transcriptional regulator YiaG